MADDDGTFKKPTAKKRKVKNYQKVDRPKRERKAREVLTVSGKTSWKLKDLEKLVEALHRHPPTAVESISSVLGNKTPQEVENFIKKTVNLAFCPQPGCRKVDVDPEKGSAPLELWMSLVQELLSPKRRADYSASYSKVLDVIARNEPMAEESGFPNLKWSNLYRYISDLLDDKAVLQPLSDMESLVLLDMVHRLGETLHSTDNEEKRRLLDLKYQLYQKQSQWNPDSPLGKYTAGMKAFKNDFSNVDYRHLSSGGEPSSSSTSSTALSTISPLQSSSSGITASGSQGRLGFPTTAIQDPPSHLALSRDLGDQRKTFSVMGNQTLKSEASFTPVTLHPLIQAGVTVSSAASQSTTVSVIESNHPILATSSSTYDTTPSSATLIPNALSMPYSQIGSKNSTAKDSLCVIPQDLSTSSEHQQISTPTSADSDKSHDEQSQSSQKPSSQLSSVVDIDATAFHLSKSSEDTQSSSSGPPSAASKTSGQPQASTDNNDENKNWDKGPPSLTLKTSGKPQASNDNYENDDDNEDDDETDGFILPHFYSLNPLSIPTHLLSFRPKISLDLADQDCPVMIDIDIQPSTSDP